MYRARPELPAFYTISLVDCLLPFKVRIFQVGPKIFQFPMTLLKVIKPQKQSFLKLYCPENERSISQNSAL